MKNLCSFILTLSIAIGTKGQEVGFQLNGGLMNYAGDLQDKAYTLNQSNFTAGANIFFKVNHVLLRAGFNYGQVYADDKYSTEFRLRNLNFSSVITDANLCIEYDFLNTDNDKKITPYIFGGIGVFHFNPYTYYDSIKVYLQPFSTEGEGLAAYPNRKPYSLTDLSIPLGIGFKFKLISNIFLGAEFNTRILYTDYLDDVSKTYPDATELLNAKGQLAVDLSFRSPDANNGAPYPSGRLRGNSGHNDNYYTSTVTFTYIFPPSSSKSGYKVKRNKNALSCPKNVR